MYQDYFELLDIDRSLPAWAYMKKIHDARAKFEREYNGDLPDQVMSAIAVFGQPEGKADYDQLLAMADAEKVEINAGDIERLKSVAGFTHFAFESNDDGTHQVTRQPIELPPAHQEDARVVTNLKLHRADTKSVVDAPPPNQTPPKASAQRPGKDDYGRVNEQIPPLVLGTNVYELYATVPQHLTHVADLGECYQLMWQDDDGDTFSHHDHMGPLFGPDFYRAGTTYKHIVIKNTQTGKATTEGIYTLNAPTNNFTLSGAGIFGLFPWYTKYLKGRNKIRDAQYLWGRDKKTMPFPPVDYFGRGGWSKQVTDIFVTYVREVYYWGYCYWDGFRTPATKVRQISDRDATFVLTKMLGITQRDLGRNGL